MQLANPFLVSDVFLFSFHFHFHFHISWDFDQAFAKKLKSQKWEHRLLAVDFCLKYQKHSNYLWLEYHIKHIPTKWRKWKLFRFVKLSLLNSKGGYYFTTVKYVFLILKSLEFFLYLFWTQYNRDPIQPRIFYQFKSCSFLNL